MGDMNAMSLTPPWVSTLKISIQGSHDGHHIPQSPPKRAKQGQRKTPLPFHPPPKLPILLA